MDKPLPLLLLLVSCTFAEEAGGDVEKVMQDLAIIPDVLSEAPLNFLKVEYADGVVVDKGNELTPNQTRAAPQVEWPTAATDTYYVVLMTSPDSPLASNPIWREGLHWLVVNIPGLNVSEGEALAPYLGPLPPKENMEIFRYVLLVYQQTERLEFDEPRINATTFKVNFSTQQFADKYKLGTPLAGNVFRAKWDEWVPTLHKMLNLQQFM